MYVKCKVLKERMGKRGNTICWHQVGMGFRKYFHMSQAAKWSKLRGYPYFDKKSYYAKYTFLRESDYTKMKKKWNEPFDWSKLMSDFKEKGD